MLVNFDIDNLLEVCIIERGVLSLDQLSDACIVEWLAVVGLCKDYQGQKDPEATRRAP